MPTQVRHGQLMYAWLANMACGPSLEISLCRGGHCCCSASYIKLILTRQSKQGGDSSSSSWPVQAAGMLKQPVSHDLLSLLSAKSIAHPVQTPSP
jgi:hypothetical protein